MQNPLLATHQFPLFDQIKPEHIKSAVENLLEKNRAAFSKLLPTESPTWNTVIAPLDEVENQLSHAWSIVKHLKSVAHSDELTKAYRECLPMVSDYLTELSQNPILYDAYQKISHSEELSTFTEAQKKAIEHNLRDFKLSGIDLPEKAKQRYASIIKELSDLENQFETNLLNATKEWSLHILDPNELKGVPEHVLTQTKQAASQKGQEGFLLTLDFPTYYGVIAYCDNRKIRETVYTAYVTRASDQGPHAGKSDNTPIMNKILQLRHELAQLLQFNNYAEFSLATKMVKNPTEVLDFLWDFVERCQKQAKNELNTLMAFAKESNGITDFSAWDMAYFSEKLKTKNFSFNTESIRPYFLENTVLKGLFTIASRVFGITITQEPTPSVWHPDVRFFSVSSQDKIIGYFYLDLYARPNKRAGAWMDECQIRRKKHNGEIQKPISYLICNFNPPNEKGISLLNHDEVMTLFHEFGHNLQHLLTTVDVSDVSGINGIAWDAVELPSQMMEHWCWNEEALQLISEHFQTGEKLPDDLFKKMSDSKNFQASLQLLRQLEYSLFDFQIHQFYDPTNPNFIQDTLNALREKISLIPVPTFNRFQHSFSHIFAGGYAAGYYSYLWAEVLACDAFSKFEEEGIFNEKTGQDFRNTILALGGSRDAEDVFYAFRGRKPSIEPLLHYRGIL